ARSGRVLRGYPAHRLADVASAGCLERGGDHARDEPGRYPLMAFRLDPPEEALGVVLGLRTCVPDRQELRPRHPARGSGGHHLPQEVDDATGAEDGALDQRVHRVTGQPDERTPATAREGEAHRTDLLSE